MNKYNYLEDGAFVKINNYVVQPLPNVVPKDPRPVKGADLFEKAFCTIYICAPPEQGKTTVIGNVLKACIDKNTTVFAFVGTIDADDGYASIQKYCENNGIVFRGTDSIFDEEDGHDELDSVVRRLKHNVDHYNLNDYENDLIEKMTGIQKPPKPRKSKFQVPKYFFILDDLSTELRHESVARLLKEHRHIKSKVIIATQGWKDLRSKDVRNQIGYILIFKGIDELTLKEIYTNSGIGHINFEKFKKMYELATSEEHSFFYIDRKRSRFRINFNIAINPARIK